MFTIDRDRCLLWYPLPVGEEIGCQLMRLSSTNPCARILKWRVLGYAEGGWMDASLDQPVVLAGQSNKFEVCNASAWRDAVLSGSGNDGGDLLPDLDLLAF
jgi:DNA-binding transcriptional regulator/RsmH inhibitor MraZ